MTNRISLTRYLVEQQRVDGRIPGDLRLLLEVVARAWDSTGALQPASAADVWNPKGYLNTSWARVHVDVR